MHSPAALTQLMRDALSGEVADGLDVVAGSGMNVTVNAGTALVGRDPSYSINVIGTETVNVGAASPSNPINAVIVAYVDRNVAGDRSVTDNTNDAFKLKAISGAAASNPADPTNSAIQAAIGASNPFIILARVKKRAGATSISNNDIADLRKMMTLPNGRINNASLISDGTIESKNIKDGSILPRNLLWSDFVQSKRNNTSKSSSSITQHGVAMLNVPSNALEATIQITFPKSFTSGTIPTVVCSFGGYGQPGDGWTDTPNASWGGCAFSAVNVTNTSFTARCRRFDGAQLLGTYYVNWIAIGEQSN